MLAVVAGDAAWHRLTLGFPTQTMPRLQIYETIAHDPRDCVVLEVPVGVRTGTDRIGTGEALSFYQPIHRKRLISGSTSRMPLDALAFYRASPAIMFLAGEPPIDGDLLSDVRTRIDELHVGYIVIHSTMLDPGRLQSILRLLSNLSGLTRLDSDPEVIVFRVDA